MRNQRDLINHCKQLTNTQYWGVCLVICAIKLLRTIELIPLVFRIAGLHAVITFHMLLEMPPAPSTPRVIVLITWAGSLAITLTLYSLLVGMTRSFRLEGR